MDIANKIVYPDAAVREAQKLKDNDKQGFNLTNEDVMFADIRNKHFNSAGPALNKQIADIQRMMEDKSQKTI